MIDLEKPDFDYRFALDWGHRRHEAVDVVAIQEILVDHGGLAAAVPDPVYAMPPYVIVEADGHRRATAMVDVAAHALPPR